MLSAQAALAGVFASSFLSATLLPGNSEIVFVALLHQAPELEGRALAVATLGNTLGGLTSYLVGRLFPRPQKQRALAWLTRYGSAALLLSWVPVIGDGLCVAAGWLRQNVVAVTVLNRHRQVRALLGAGGRPVMVALVTRMR